MFERAWTIGNDTIGEELKTHLLTLSSTAPGSKSLRITFLFSTVIDTIRTIEGLGQRREYIQRQKEEELLTGINSSMN